MNELLTDRDQVTSRALLRLEVEDFLFTEAELLDQWRLEEWLELWADDGHYVIPSPDCTDGDPATDTMFAHDDLLRLRGRVDRLLSKRAYREFPFARTRHVVSNVRVRETDGDELDVRANFVVYRSRNQRPDFYVGEYVIRLRRTPDGLRMVLRRANLDLELLAPHGTVSIIL